MKPAPIAAIVACSLLLSGCVGPEIVDVDISIAPIDMAELPLAGSEEIVTFDSGMAAVLGDLSAELPDLEPLHVEMVASEQALGTAIIAGLQDESDEVAPTSRAPLADATQALAGAPAIAGSHGTAVAGTPLSTEAADPIAAEMFMGPYMLVSLLPLMYDTAGKMQVGESSDKPGEGGSGSASGGLSIERSGTDTATITLTDTAESRSGGAHSTGANKVVIDGRICPAADGEFDFTVTIHNDAAGTTAEGTASMQQDISVRVTGHLNDEGVPERIDMEGAQGTRQTTKDGREIYVETRNRQTVTGLGSIFSMGSTRPELIRSSSEATDADIRRIAQQGGTRAGMVAAGAVMGVWMSMWSGGCVKIDAASPGVVQSYAKSTIDVKVASRLSGEPVTARVDLKLSGTESIDTTVIPKTPGAFTHTAGGYGSSASIGLEANSRRGTATLTLAISVKGGAYHASGGGGDFHGEGVICDLSKPFTIAGGGITILFTPSSPEGGGYAYTGSLQGFPLSGGEAYSVTYLGDVAVSIKGWGDGIVESPLGTFSNYGEEQYTLTPLETTPAECGGGWTDGILLGFGTGKYQASRFDEE